MRTPARWLHAAARTAAAGLLVPALLVPAQPAGATAEQTGTTLTPALLSTSTTLVNPLTGQYTWMGQAAQPSGWPAPDRYDRDTTYWGRLEPTKGAYDFSSIDSGLAAAGAVRGKYGFRVMAYCPGCWMTTRSDWPQVTPSFLPLQPGTDIPNWNSETFLSRWEALWTALGDRYADDPRLGYVDVGGFGKYGEWTPAGTDITKANAMRLVAAVAQAFPRKHVLLSAVPIWTRRPDVATDAVAAFPNLGLRSDCLGQTDMQYPGNGTEDVWRTRPFVTEWCTGGDPLVSVKQVPAYHVSTVSSGNRRLSYSAMTSAQRSAYLTTLRTSGYRYAVTQATLSAITPGRQFTVGLTLRNQGVAPTYDRWTVRLVLKDAAGARVATLPLSLDLRGRLPGTSTFGQTLTAPSALRSGSYDLAIEVVDPEHYSPPMRLADTGRDPDGSYVLGSVGVGDLGAADQSVLRLAGPDRFAVSAAVSEASFAPGVPVAYVATGLKFPDALSAAPVGGTLGGPVLLVASDRVPDPIAAELGRLSPRRIVVLGGPGSVSDAVLTALGRYAPSVDRISGADRFEASAAMSRATFAPGVPVAYVATGLKFPDALSGAPAASVEGGPVLLVGSTWVPPSIATELSRLAPRRIVVVGGPGSVSDDVLSALRAYSPSVSRISGADRYAASANISRAAFAPDVPVAYVATGEKFPDALSGGPAAGTEGGPVLLVRSDAIPDPIRDELTRLRPGRIVVLGGSASVSTAVQRDLTTFVTGAS